MNLSNLVKYFSFFLNPNKSNKPKGILKLEKIYNIKIEEHAEGHILSTSNVNKYLLDNDKNVIGLNLGRNAITEIKGLENFPELINLVLYENKIKKIEGLEKLIKLRFLSLDNNQIEKIEGLEQNDHLSELVLYSNKISKIENLQHLKKLQILYLFGNQISKIENLGHLVQLKELYLSSNSISKIEALNNLVRLKELYLDKNQIKKIEDLDNLESLTKLVLNDNQIEKIEGLDNLLSLSTLNLESNKIKYIENISKLKNLTKFETYGNLIEKYAEILNENEIGKYVIHKKVYFHSGESYEVEEDNLGLIVGRFETLNEALISKHRADIKSLQNLAGANIVDFIIDRNNYDQLYSELQNYYHTEFNIEIENKYYFYFPEKIDPKQGEKLLEILSLSFHEIVEYPENEKLDIVKFNEERNISSEF
ncbi:leucine-rich repeat protein [Flavobacterium sp. LHD-80]|uniref:leucine-rich repeat domain-containing protein n=1 Tax=Flavobacterium sp. LHD-80 TaxID=3071411 RepID=UPI0027E03BF7|nr:leucine-rich repeat protein [Flavobacterium sp. LHD-80]MDQ6469481.1 leucine-rich repeat protein [Flavobacterium sp. LHD-80]